MEKTVPYSVFICHKKTDDASYETRDSLLAQTLFNALVSRGISAFLAQQEIPRVGETEYMRTIDRALDEVDILVVVSTAPEYLESRWVRYEWESFVNDILSGRKKNGRIFSYIDGFSADQLPRPLRLHQVIVHGDGQVDRLFESIEAALRISRLDRITEQGGQTVDRFRELTRLIAESHLLEMELFVNNPLGQMAMSRQQSLRMQEIITRLRTLMETPEANKTDADDA
jgi:hypothetical protein